MNLIQIYSGWEEVKRGDIQWLGIRIDHAYISLQGRSKVKCIDIIPKNDEFEIYAIVRGPF